MRIIDESPCFECKPPKRHSHCHGNCNEYKTWSSTRSEKKAEIEEVKRKDADTAAYHRNILKKR